VGNRAAGWFWWRFPKSQVSRQKLQIRDPKARADVEDNIRKSISQLLGGAAVLFGAWLTYTQTQKTWETSHEQLISQQRQTQKTLRASHDQLINQQVSKGFEQLGSNQIFVRLGGIYSLEYVMNNSKEYHQRALEALCAFVRDSSKTSKNAEPGTDVQAALTVIGRRVAGEGVVDLTGAYIPKVRLVDVDLTDADLSNADFSNADLRGSKLSSAKLIGTRLNYADLSGASLSDAKLHGAELTGAHLEGADLNGAKLVNADLSNADVSNAFVSQAQLDKACGDKETKLPIGFLIKPCHR
jgi:hypothetical protein